MALIRRVVGAPATLHKADIGAPKFRRVWLKSEPRGKIDNQLPHWYYETRSKEGAINEHARRSRKTPNLFDAEN